MRGPSGTTFTSLVMAEQKTKHPEPPHPALWATFSPLGRREYRTAADYRVRVVGTPCGDSTGTNTRRDARTATGSP